MTALAHGAGVAFALLGGLAVTLALVRGVAGAEPDRAVAEYAVVGAVLVGIGVGLCTA